jgi:hypothetical protein
MDGYNKRLKLKISKLNAWETMNIPPYFQGYQNDRTNEESPKIGGIFSIISTMNLRESLLKSERFKWNSEGFINPVQIANMLLSRKWKEFYLNESNRMQDKDLLTISNNIKEMVITKCASDPKIKKFELNAVLVFDFPEALSLMCSSIGTGSFVLIIRLKKRWERHGMNFILMVLL